MAKVFVIDQARCNGCHGCQIACKDEHVGNEWLPYQLPQPDTGHFWMKVNQTTHGQVPKVKVEYKPFMCQQCDACDLVEKYPDIVTKRDDGLVSIDVEKAKGVRDLVDACPYGAVYWNEELNIAQKCDGCAHLVDGGEIPHCVDMCVTEALRFGDEEDFAEEIAQAEYFAEGMEASKPRVYYLNTPGLFIGGEVWDPIDNEVIEGATVALTLPDGSAVTTKTNDWGDFWFRKLKPGTYHLSITADGFEPVTKGDIKLTESLNVGDFPLEKQNTMRGKDIAFV